MTAFNLPFLKNLQSTFCYSTAPSKHVSVFFTTHTQTKLMRKKSCSYPCLKSITYFQPMWINLLFLLASPSKISIYTDSWLTVYFSWTLMFWKYFFYCKYGWNKHMVETTLRFKLVALGKEKKKQKRDFCHLCTIRKSKFSSTQRQKKHLYTRCNPIVLVCFASYLNFTKNAIHRC